MRVLVTGATGFVGQALLAGLLVKKFSVSALVRRENNLLSEEVTKIRGGDLTDVHDWQSVFHNIEAVIHVAGRAHIVHDDVADPLAEFRKVNTTITLELAKQAAAAGVKRFIYISSIKVNGEATSRGMVFRADDTHIPTDHYGLSKYEAEQGLLAVAAETGMEVVMIRPPLVYGPGVRANFASMIRWMQRGIPLPFGAIDNRRSFIALDNLVSFIIHCIDHPKAANEIFLISDGEDVSTTVLLQKMSKALGKKSCLMPVPERWLRLVAKILGREDEAGKVLNSLQVDSSKARDVLGWKPVITMDEQLHKTAEWYLSEKNL